MASVLVATNWLVYVIAVNSNHVADAALGYYINPLVNVLLGLVFLSERLRPLQKTSITVAATAVVMLTIIAGQPPVQALMLAFSFGFYGLVKKRVDMSAMASLTAETLIWPRLRPAICWCWRRAAPARSGTSAWVIACCS